MPKLQQLLQKIDAVLANDPTEIEVNGEKRPLAPYHAERRAFWMEKLVDGKVSEPLQIAARAQHIGRWEVPRSTYPDGRVGYLKWRTDLKKMHGEKTAVLMRESGYDETTIERVKTMIAKKGIKRDAEVQVLEDALCLVFLESQFTAVAQKESDKIINILQKTWKKMSPKGHELALQLPMSDTDRAIIEEAIT
ncbi:MAG: DUF4202 domain-containing protein [Chloroflexota bacterium]